MKKKISVLLALVMIIGIVSACTTNDVVQKNLTYTDITVALEEQKLDLEGVSNARQLGGYPTSDGRVVRSDVLLRTGKLDTATEDDIAMLTGQYNLAHIVDLRSIEETQMFADPDIEGAELHNLVVHSMEVLGEIQARTKVEVTGEPFKDGTLASIQAMDYMAYAQDIYEYYASGAGAIEAYRDLFDILLNNDDGSVLFHCHSGKDRTGVAAILVLSALGVDRDIIKQDFLLSNTALKVKIDAALESASAETDSEELLSYVAMMNGVGEPFLDFYFEEIERSYGSMEKYLETEMGLGSVELQTLRDKYTVQP